MLIAMILQFLNLLPDILIDSQIRKINQNLLAYANAFYLFQIEIPFQLHNAVAADPTPLPGAFKIYFHGNCN